MPALPRILHTVLLSACLLFTALSSPALAAGPTPASPGQTAPALEARPRLDVVFVLDTTSSMTDLIAGAKEKIWSIASRMASGKPTPRIRVGLVGYRDRGDAYITKRFDLSEDLDGVFTNLQSFEADGGGDGPEHVGQALGEAVSLMGWSQEPRTAKMLFLVGDAPAHDDYGDGWNTKVWAKKAIAKGIVVNTVRCGTEESTEVLFRELAQLADGSFVSIGQSGGMAAVSTPFDSEIAKLNAEIADKTLVGGSAAARFEGNAELTALKGMSAGSSSDRASYKAKAAPAAPATEVVRATGAITLNAAPERVSSLGDDELPDVLRKLPKGEREAYVRQQNAEQKALKAKVDELAKQREVFLKTKVSARKDSFDEQVFESVKRSAAKAGVAY